MVSTYQICSYDNATVGQIISAAITLSNVSLAEIISTANQLVITIIDIPIPSLVVGTTVVADTAEQLYLNISVECNINGFFYYSVQQLSSSADAPAKFSYSLFVTALVASSIILQSQSDYLTYLYSGPRNIFIGNLSVSSIFSSTI